MAGIIIKLKKINRIFCRGMACKVNAGRDAVIISIMIIISVFIIGYSRWPAFRNNNQKAIVQESQLTEQQSVQKEEENVAQIVASINTSAWTPYQNTWYGLALKYPSEW